MKTQIVYALAASLYDLFLQELWASVYSLRLYEPDREVRVFCDEGTANYARQFPSFISLLTELIVVPVPEHYTQKERSRAIKTNIRQYVSGRFLYVDTDTIFAGTLEYIDNLTCDLAAVPEFHVPLKDYIYRNYSIGYVKHVFDEDISDAERQHNGGVMFAADSDVAHDFYERWHKNWLYSTFQKGNSQDQPSLIKSDKEMGYVIKELPGEYNCQMAMSIEHFYGAKIIHYLHFDLLPKPHHPFLDKSIYHKIKKDAGVSEATANLIANCKSAFITPSAIVDGDTVTFLLSNPGHVFMAIAKEGGWLMSIMNKVAVALSFVLKCKKVKIY